MHHVDATLVELPEVIERLTGGLLGYAQFPGGDPLTDGVVITTTAFGRIGTQFGCEAAGLAPRLFARPVMRRFHRTWSSCKVRSN